VIETLCDGPAVVIGHAFGNRIARCLAADRPALVDLVVLLSSSGRAADAGDRRGDPAGAGGRHAGRYSCGSVRAAWFAPAATSRPGLTAGRSR
jgi:pimeloyl-ACP methyl ester carboxylesterase